MASWIDFVQPVVSAIDSALNYVGILKTNKTNKEINESNIGASYDLLKTQNAFSEDMWNKSNQYNSPANQAELYRRAGLNPAMYMKGQSGSVAQQITSNSASVPSSIPMQAPHIDLSGLAGSVSSYYDNQIKAEQAYQMKVQSDYIESKEILDLARRRSDVVNSKLDAKTKKKELIAIDDRLDYLRLTKKARVSQTIEAANQVRMANDRQEYDDFYNTLMKPIEYALMQHNYRMSEKEEQQIGLVVDKLVQEIQNLIKEGKLTKAQADKVVREYNILAPEEWRSNDEMKEYGNKHTRRVQQFFDRSSRLVNKIVPKLKLK